VPELPEVEVVRAGLAPVVAGAVVTAVEVLDERSLKRHRGPSDDFVDRLVGGILDAAVRRGKFLWFPFEPAAVHDEPLALVAHLGMSGQVLLRDRDAEPDRLMRVRLDVESPAHGPLRLAFVDQRIFGSMALDETVPTLDGAPAGWAGAELLGSGPSPTPTVGRRADPARASWELRVPQQVSHIARDPLDPAFDQGLLSGVGNIYADESLWAARVHPEQPTASLSRARARTLLAEVRAVLLRALGEGGTSFDAQYVNVNGQSGYFSHSLAAYGQQGKPCPRCGTPIVREAFMNRSSHLCPRCQRVRAA
jgi:formamidopyrimidine-DNA glycosylase